jgi:tetratricopeptide (TPR) repeat protein
MRRVGRVAVWVVVVGVLGGAVWWAVGEWRTNGRIAAAKAALDADDPAAALREVAAVLPARADSAEVQFLAAQASRRTGDFPAAQKHLARAKALDWVPEAIDLETALIQAQNNRLTREYEFYLRKCLRDGHPDAHLIAEVLVPYDFARFRLFAVAENATLWTEKRPNNPRAWALLGECLQRIPRRAAAVAAFQKAVDLDPDDRSSLVYLATLLVESKKVTPDLARRLEAFAAAHPTDAEALTLLADCRALDGDAAAADKLLERALAARPGFAPALSALGRIVLDDGRPAEALPFLTRAAELDPSNPQLLHALFQCHRQLGHADAAAAAEKRWADCLADRAQLGQTVTKIQESPEDPDLRTRAGEICLRQRRTDDGLAWLESALMIRPDHPPAHAILARHYLAAGDARQAEYHRRRADSPKKP